jgi:gliding motility-associated-like protein
MDDLNLNNVFDKQLREFSARLTDNVPAMAWENLVSEYDTVVFDEFIKDKASNLEINTPNLKNVWANLNKELPKTHLKKSFANLKLLVTSVLLTVGLLFITSNYFDELFIVEKENYQEHRKTVLNRPTTDDDFEKNASTQLIEDFDGFEEQTQQTIKTNTAESQSNNEKLYSDFPSVPNPQLNAKNAENNNNKYHNTSNGANLNQNVGGYSPIINLDKEIFCIEDSMPEAKVYLTGRVENRNNSKKYALRIGDENEALKYLATSDAFKIELSDLQGAVDVSLFEITEGSIKPISAKKILVVNHKELDFEMNRQGFDRYVFRANSSDNNNFTWYVDDKRVGNSSTLLYSFKDQFKGNTSETHSVALTVNHNAGCAKKVIKQLENTDLFGKTKITYPNIFTPNGDGINDYFKIDIENVKLFHIRVFDNKSNSLVFESNDINTPWRGDNKFSGELCYGKHTVKIRYETEHGEVNEVVDSIVVLRN